MTVLKSAIERLIANSASAQDREQVQSAIAAGALSIATGQGAVSLGGDANGAFIVTGDGNVIVRVDSVVALDRLLQKLPTAPASSTREARPTTIAPIVAAGRATRVSNSTPCGTCWLKPRSVLPPLPKRSS
jgi:hypothetical protein